MWGHGAGLGTALVVIPGSHRLGAPASGPPSLPLALHAQQAEGAWSLSARQPGSFWVGGLPWTQELLETGPSLFLSPWQHRRRLRHPPCRPQPLVVPSHRKLSLMAPLKKLSLQGAAPCDSRSEQVGSLAPDEGRGSCSGILPSVPTSQRPATACLPRPQGPCPPLPTSHCCPWAPVPPAPQPSPPRPPSWTGALQSLWRQHPGGS